MQDNPAYHNAPPGGLQKSIINVSLKTGLCCYYCGVIRKITFIMFLTGTSGFVFGQYSKPIFIGIQPAITVEPFYAEGELDVNVFPVVAEFPVGQQIDLRIVPILNYHIGGEENGVSDVGSYFVLPVFITQREEGEALPHGFYIGPVLGLGRNLINDHFTTTLAVEPGYLFKAEKSFTIALGLQLGGSHFSYDDNPNKWVFHWGPKVSLGFWVNKG